MGCYALLREIFLIQGSNPHLLHLLHCQVGSLPLVPPGKPSLPVTDTKFISSCGRKCHGLNQYFPKHFIENTRKRKGDQIYWPWNLIWKLTIHMSIFKAEKEPVWLQLTWLSPNFFGYWVHYQYPGSLSERPEGKWVLWLTQWPFKTSILTPSLPSAHDHPPASADASFHRLLLEERLDSWVKILLKKLESQASRGSVVKNPPANAGDMGSIHGLGRSHMSRSNEARAPQPLSLGSRVQEPQLLSPHVATTEAGMP